MKIETTFNFNDWVICDVRGYWNTIDVFYIGRISYINVKVGRDGFLKEEYKIDYKFSWDPHGNLLDVFNPNNLSSPPVGRYVEDRFLEACPLGEDELWLRVLRSS